MPSFLRIAPTFVAPLSCFEVLHAPALAQSYGIAGTTTIKDGIPATSAFLRDPASVVADAAGNVYVADHADNRVRKVGRDGVISTVAGTGIPGHANGGDAISPAALLTIGTPAPLTQSSRDSRKMDKDEIRQLRKRK
jgi:NHL repeat